MLQRACLTTEFRSFPLRQAERAFFRDVNDHLPIPYPVAETISEPWHKVFLLVQVQLSRAPWPNRLAAKARQELYVEKRRIDVVLDAALRCMVDILGHRHDGRGVSVALDVLRSVRATVWEGSDNELLQIEGIGPAKMTRLVEAGVKTVKQLARLEFWHIERLLSRNPPFGQQILHQLAGFPVLTLQLDILGCQPGPHVPSTAGLGRQSPRSLPPWIARLVLGYENEVQPAFGKCTLWTTAVIEGDDGRLLWFWRGSVRRLAGGKELLVGLCARKGESLRATFACESVVGATIRVVRQV